LLIRYPASGAGCWKSNAIRSNNRRDFITLLGGAAAAWPVVAWAQQPERMRRIGVLSVLAEADTEGQARVQALRAGLEKFGWTVGRNLQITRWGGGDADRMRHSAAELVALAPDVIVALGGAAVGPLQQASRTMPIVFTGTPDPVGSGFVASLARPGGNATGFTQFEFGISAKWLELLREIAPRVSRVAVLRDTTVPGGIGQLGAIQSVARSFGVELSPIDARNASEIEQAVIAFTPGSNSGLIVLSSATGVVHRDLIVTLAARYRLPAIYPYRVFVTGGGLISYGPNIADQPQLAADYIDRILKGAKAADLPVQESAKQELTINLKTAKALGLDVPASLLARADDVIE
jgi:putative tryptophan/tyrosine transport system substrate-binding protein